MKKSIYLTTITIITVICIIAGSLYHIGGLALGLFDNLIPHSDNSPGNVCTKELSVDEFSNLIFDAAVLNINITAGDNYTVSYKCNERLVPKIKSSGDTLTISQRERTNYKGNTTSEITVTIPDGAALNKLSFNTGVGEVNLDALTAADAEFDTGVGDLYVTDCSFATCDVDSGTGNLNFENCAFDKMDIDGGTGNITVTSSQSLDGYMMDLDSGIGSITINGNDYGDEYEVNEKAEKVKHLIIDSGLGDIELKY
jgi:DUF4097 and DUF4098 domain-containing protein YvlB